MLVFKFSLLSLSLPTTRRDLGVVGGEPLIGGRFARGGTACRFFGWTGAKNGGLNGVKRQGTGI